MKKLYSVRCEKTFQIFVMAGDKHEAEQLALRHADEEATNSDRNWDIFSPSEVTGIEQVPREWRGSIPWGCDDDSLVRDILAKGGEK